MLTTRGWWFLLIVAGVLLVVIWIDARAVILACATLLIWFFASWTMLVFRWHWLRDKLYVVRAVLDERGQVRSLWAERPFTLRVQLRSLSWLATPYLRITDRVPYGATPVTDEITKDGTVRDGKPLEVTYRFTCSAAGLIRFEGLQVQMIDLQGMFYIDTFIRSVEIYRVMPVWQTAHSHMPTTKSHNILPLLGGHRFRRPGSGSELLDLRDYMAGDPPKTIAWKVSARRNRLMTKVFESEVPIRCTLFVDTSDSVRVGGPGKNALARLIRITATVAQACVGARDLPGLCLFDEHQVRTYLPPVRNSRHLLQILSALTDSACLLPTAGDVDAHYLLNLAYGFAKEVYPDLLEEEINTYPWWYAFLAPQNPSVIRMKPILARKFWQWPWVWLKRSVRYLGLWFYQQIWLRLPFTTMLRGRFLRFLTLGLVTYDDKYPAMRMGYYTLMTSRKKLAALLAARADLGPGGLSLLIEDDEQFTLHCQRFLGEHNVPYSLPLFGIHGKYLFAAPNKVDVLSSALLRAVHRGKDNELYVFMVDLLDPEYRLAPLLSAIRVAVARHHQVMVICPWPEGIPIPSDREESTTVPRIDFDNPLKFSGLTNLLEATTNSHFFGAYYNLRRIFGKLGVSLLCAQASDSEQLILKRLETLRQGARGGVR